MQAKLVHLVLLAARQPHDNLSSPDLAALCTAVQMGVLDKLTPSLAWTLLKDGLQAPHPAQFFLVLRECGGLKRWLPEVDALFGVPQLSDAPEPVDVGEHQMRVLAQAASAGVALNLRFAALMHKIGKGGTPIEIWPSHYKHEQRGHALLDKLVSRMAVPQDALDLAHLAIAECDRVHRASDMRAGAMAAMLQRLDVQNQPERFAHLLTICSCDYAAYAGHQQPEYAKAQRWRLAWSAYAGAQVGGLDPDAALMARAEAIAAAFARAPI